MNNALNSEWSKMYLEFLKRFKRSGENSKFPSLNVMSSWKNISPWKIPTTKSHMAQQQFRQSISQSAYWNHRWIFFKFQIWSFCWRRDNLRDKRIEGPTTQIHVFFNTLAWINLFFYSSLFNICTIAKVCTKDCMEFGLPDNLLYP